MSNVNTIVGIETFFGISEYDIWGGVKLEVKLRKRKSDRVGSGYPADSNRFQVDF